MIVSAIYVFLAILGLSFLIFIHELGHYLMARRVGMKVETFSIGFGRPLYSWVWDGVKWQVGWLLFGGFVKIAGAETDQEKDPYDIPDGFFGKGPWDRIKVALAGPLVNILFALLLFALLWATGGRVKSFSEFTHKIGWLDTKSELYRLGVRPGDEISAYGNYPYQSFKDHIFAPMVSGESVEIKGFHVDEKSEQRVPYSYQVPTYPHPYFIESSAVTAGILNPASFIIYDRLPSGRENPLPEGSPLKGSGILYGDRILWVDGELIYSFEHLSDVLNDNRAYLTIVREGNYLQRRVPRVPASDLRPNAEFREELIDWQYEAGLGGKKFSELFTIPYNLTYEGVVEHAMRFIDKADQESAFPEILFSPLDEPLRPGDRIVAVQGAPVAKAYEILKQLQQKRIHVVVERSRGGFEPVPYDEADAAFYKGVDMTSLAAITSSIGTSEKNMQAGSLYLLKPVVPKAVADIPLTSEQRAKVESLNTERRKAIEAIEDREKRQSLLKRLESDEQLLVLGLPARQDRKVFYNPGPNTLFMSVSQEIGRTLQALFSGALSPTLVSGPVGIMQIVHSTSMVSWKEALFWIAAISLNLGILNLLPIPVLDGGTILFSLFELATGRRIKPKSLEKISIVFGILLISFFVFVTYHDILRVFGSFF